mmetsp:Transcript_31697/g.72089  ORF Transcript_31697/g.72089 Transcript_31697/m.72089 type:complete len:277 (+) Transcript_31697:49-879(+)
MITLGSVDSVCLTESVSWSFPWTMGTMGMSMASDLRPMMEVGGLCSPMSELKGFVLLSMHSSLNGDIPDIVASGSPSASQSNGLNGFGVACCQAVTGAAPRSASAVIRTASRASSSRFALLSTHLPTESWARSCDMLEECCTFFNLSLLRCSRASVLLFDLSPVFSLSMTSPSSMDSTFWLYHLSSASASSALLTSSRQATTVRLCMSSGTPMAAANCWVSSCACRRPSSSPAATGAASTSSPMPPSSRATWALNSASQAAATAVMYRDNAMDTRC